MFDWLRNMAKTKDDRRFEILDERLLDIQGKLLKLPAVLKALNNLNGKVDTMSSNIDRIEKEVAEIGADVTVVRDAVGGLKTVIADLKEQVAKGQVDQTRLDAAAASLEKIDDDLDAITAPEPTPEVK